MARTCEVAENRHSLETRWKPVVKLNTSAVSVPKSPESLDDNSVPTFNGSKVELPDGGAKRMKVCVQCIRSGKIRKAVKKKPFELPS